MAAPRETLFARNFVAPPADTLGMNATLLRELARVFLHEADTKPGDEGARLADISEALYARSNAPLVLAPRRGDRQHGQHRTRSDRSAPRQPHIDVPPPQRQRRR